MKFSPYSSKLPDDCSYEDIQNHLYVIEKIHRTEFFNGKPDEKKAAADFLFPCETWEDDRPINEQIQQKYNVEKIGRQDGEHFLK